MKQKEALAKAWTRYEALSGRISSYLKSSEEEFATLIAALDACWNMAESVQDAGSRLAEITRAAQDNCSVLRESMLGGCQVFRDFLNQIDDASSRLASSEKETKALLALADQLQTSLAPLHHIAFHFRLAASQLSDADSAAILTNYSEMRKALDSLKRGGDSQEVVLRTILLKLSTVNQSIVRASRQFALRASESEERLERNVESLYTVPRDMLRVQNRTNALGMVLTNGLRESIKALQGHDAVRQRLEHILRGLDRLRSEPGAEPQHGLLLERQQAKSVLDQIVGTGTRISNELMSVIGCAQGIAGGDQASTAGEEEISRFEMATDQMTLLHSELDEFLAGEEKIGKMVITAIVPVRELLGANQQELETLALAMRSMKLLAFNVLVSAERMPSSRAIGALGQMTSDVSEQVLLLEKDLTQRFAMLSDDLQIQSTRIVDGLECVESRRAELLNSLPGEDFRNSRRLQRAEVTQLNQQAHQLMERTEALLNSFTFVERGAELLGELDETIGSLVGLHPTSTRSFDLEAASAGYTMGEQYEAHAMLAGGPKHTRERLTEPAAGQDYGDNVELF